MEQDDPLQFTWSKHVSLKDLWVRVGIVAREETIDDGGDLSEASMNDSRVPSYLPVETLRCVASGDRNSYGVGEKAPSDSSSSFFMAMVTEWVTFTYRARSCQQMLLTLKPPFRVRSTLPLPFR